MRGLVGERPIGLCHAFPPACEGFLMIGFRLCLAARDGDEPTLRRRGRRSRAGGERLVERQVAADQRRKAGLVHEREDNMGRAGGGTVVCIPGARMEAPFAAQEPWQLWGGLALQYGSA